jgi:hypothetical protein
VTATKSLASLYDGLTPGAEADPAYGFFLETFESTLRLHGIGKPGSLAVSRSLTLSTCLGH